MVPPCVAGLSRPLGPVFLLAAVNGAGRHTLSVEIDRFGSEFGQAGSHPSRLSRQSVAPLLVRIASAEDTPATLSHYITAIVYEWGQRQHPAAQPSSLGDSV